MTVRFTAENATRAPKLTIEAKVAKWIQIAANEITDTTRIAYVGVVNRSGICPNTRRGKMPSRPIA